MCKVNALHFIYTIHFYYESCHSQYSLSHIGTESKGKVDKTKSDLHLVQFIVRRVFNEIFKFFFFGEEHILNMDFTDGNDFSTPLRFSLK